MTDIILVEDHVRNIPKFVCKQWKVIPDKILKNMPPPFSIFSNGIHLGCRAGMLDIILEEDYPRTVTLKIGPNWLSSSEEIYL